MHETVALQLSLATGSPNVATAPAGDTADVVIVDGHVMVGGVWSTTVTVAVHEPVWPLRSVTVSLTVVRPSEYGPAGDWLRVILSVGSGSNEPLSMEALAAQFDTADTVTFLHMAVGGLSLNSNAPMSQCAI